MMMQCFIGYLTISTMNLSSVTRLSTFNESLGQFILCIPKLEQGREQLKKSRGLNIHMSLKRANTSFQSDNDVSNVSHPCC